MAESIFYKCPKCNTPLEIEASYNVAADIEMENIIVQVHCPKCKDTRYDNVDGYNIEKLVAKIGT